MKGVKDRQPLDGADQVVVALVQPLQTEYHVRVPAVISESKIMTFHDYS